MLLRWALDDAAEPVVAAGLDALSSLICQSQDQVILQFHLSESYLIYYISRINLRKSQVNF